MAVVVKHRYPKWDPWKKEIRKAASVFSKPRNIRGWLSSPVGVGLHRKIKRKSIILGDTPKTSIAMRASAKQNLRLTFGGWQSALP